RGAERLARGLPMVGEEGGRSLVELGWALLLDELGDRGMGALAALGELGAVGDFLGERMLEGVLDLGEEHLLEDQIASAERANGVFQLRLGKLGDPLEDRLREALADDRRGLQKAPLALGK